MERLQELLEDGIIDEVYSQLKTGKEAEVWLVSHRGEPVAAKLYKAREFRSFKNDAGYREGRTVRNTRTQRAMDKGSRFGREAAEEAWKSAEADALFALHQAGVRVPRPVLFYEGVLLMEVIGDAEGRVAPRLVDAGITREQARGLYVQLRGEIVKMLSADWIHGDLSEFNVLLSHSGPVIIDLPQVVTAAKNSRSEQFFRRDLGNMLRFFSAIDPTLSRHAGDADEIWRAYVRRSLNPEFVPSGRGVGGPQRHQQGGGRNAGPGAPREQVGPGERRGRGGERGPRHGGQAARGQGGHPDARGPRGEARGGGGQGQPQGGGDRAGGRFDSRSPRGGAQGAGGPGQPQGGGDRAGGRFDSRGPRGGGQGDRSGGRRPDSRGGGARGPEVSFRGQPRSQSAQGVAPVRHAPGSHGPSSHPHDPKRRG